MSYININGQLLPETEAKISVKDRSFRFGDSVFETLTFRNQRLYRWDMHKTRLERGLSALKIGFDTVILEREILRTLTSNNLINGSARLTVTRGEGSRGYLPTESCKPNFVIEAMNELHMERTTANLCISKYKKIPAECLPVDCKISQGLNQTLAKIEARDKGYFEALQLNMAGEIAEGASSNIFFVKGGKIFTPSLDCGILNGITRQLVLQLSPHKITEGHFTPNDLKTADEIFITNTTIKLLFVDEVEGIFRSNGNHKISQEIKTFLEEDTKK